MPIYPIASVRRAWLGVLAYALIAGGCAMVPEATEPVPAPPSLRIQIPTGIIVVQSDDSPAFAEVTRELVRQWRGSLEVVHLDGDGDFGPEVQQEIEASSKDVVIAIGLPAARAAQKLEHKKIIFCQVFNYEEHGLIRPWMKGVSAVPPVNQQFRAWKAVNPRLSSIAVIIGTGLQSLVREAQVAAQEYGLKLQYIEVNSDLALRYAYEHLTPDVQGLWLLPDNRVLSQEVLRYVFASSHANGRELLVLNQQLLALGGTLSAESDYADIAAQVLARVRESAGHRAVRGPDVTPLTKVNVTTNAAVLQAPARAVGPKGGI